MTFFPNWFGEVVLYIICMFNSSSNGNPFTISNSILYFLKSRSIWEKEKERERHGHWHARIFSLESLFFLASQSNIRCLVWNSSLRFARAFCKNFILKCCCCCCCCCFHLSFSHFKMHGWIESLMFFSRFIFSKLCVRYHHISFNSLFFFADSMRFKSIYTDLQHNFEHKAKMVMK